MNYMKHMRNENGFTLTEVLIVIIVIAILATISVVAYVGITDSARSASINSSVDQWDKVVNLQLSRKTPSSTFNSNFGRSSCLGRAATDFPAEDGFAAGACIDFSNVPGYSDADVDTAIASTTTYDDLFFTDESWWSSKRGVFNGKMPSNKVKFSNGIEMRMRGVYAGIEPWANGFWGRSTDQIRFRWMASTSDSESCGKGDNASAWAEGMAAAFGNPTIVSGRVCEMVIVYGEH